MASAAAPFAGARGCKLPRRRQRRERARGEDQANLCRDVVVEMTCIFRVPQIGAVRRGILVNAFPVDAAEPRVGLQMRCSTAVLSTVNGRPKKV